MYVCVCLCMRVCVSVCMHVCVCMWIVDECECMCGWLDGWMSVIVCPLFQNGFHTHMYCIVSISTAPSPWELTLISSLSLFSLSPSMHANQSLLRG